MASSFAFQQAGGSGQELSLAFLVSHVAFYIVMKFFNE
jgi:hypothetical protein